MKIISTYYDFNSEYPSFTGAKNISLNYVLDRHSQNLPQRILGEVNKIVETIPSKNHPTLHDLHLKEYKKLLECKTLDEARNAYPEFREILDASLFKKSRSKHLKNINYPIESLSLKILQEYYGRIKPMDEIGKEIGITNRTAFNWLREKIRFVSFPKNYITLLKASDELGNAKIAEKTKAYNRLYPEKMLEHNRHAAQGTKTLEYKAAQSERIKKYDKENPERRRKIGVFTAEVWLRLPEIREEISKEMALYAPFKYSPLMKQKEQKDRLTKAFFKKFWANHPEHKETFAQMAKTVSEEFKNKN